MERQVIFSHNIFTQADKSSPGPNDNVILLMFTNSLTLSQRKNTARNTEKMFTHLDCPLKMHKHGDGETPQEK